MQKKERVRAALAGRPVDRVPAGFWGHDYLREWSPRGLADAMLEPFHRYDWDYMKVNPRATYYCEAWGCRYEPSTDAARGPQLKEHLLHSAADLTKVGRISGVDGVFMEQLEALMLIRQGIDGADFIQTVFSPLSVAGYLAGRDLNAIRHWMRESPGALHTALATITETLSDYVRQCLHVGASGIFFATTDWGTRTNLTSELYREFGRPYDLDVLDAASTGEFNVLHVCRGDNLLLDLLDYPVHAFNWASHEKGNLSLAEGAARTTRAVMGGVAQSTLLEGTPGDVAREVKEAIASTTGTRLLIAPGCSISPQTPAENLTAAAKARVR